MYQEDILKNAYIRGHFFLYLTHFNLGVQKYGLSKQALRLFGMKIYFVNCHNIKGSKDKEKLDGTKFQNEFFSLLFLQLLYKVTL